MGKDDSKKPCWNKDCIKGWVYDRDLNNRSVKRMCLICGGTGKVDK